MTARAGRLALNENFCFYFLKVLTLRTLNLNLSEMAHNLIIFLLIMMYFKIFMMFSDDQANILFLNSFYVYLMYLHFL